MSYKVLSTIRHDGVEFLKDATIEEHQISKEAAEELVALKVIAPKVEGQIDQDAHTVSDQAINMINDAKSDVEVVHNQAEQDIKESLKQNEQLKAQGADPVTTGSPTPEQIAAEAAQVK